MWKCVDNVEKFDWGRGISGNPPSPIQKEEELCLFRDCKNLTLLDYPGKVACTVFTAGCNFRCPFCHNAPLVIDTHRNPEISLKEIYQFLEKRKGILDGVCVSGGEPLIQHGIEIFLENLKRMGYAVKLDTNGSFPDKLKKIVEEGLVDYVAMDVKKFPGKITGALLGSRGMTPGTWRKVSDIC